MNDSFDYAFMNRPIVLRKKGQLACLDRSGYTMSIQGFGPDEPMRALQCGTENHIQWLMTDSQLVIYDLPQKNSWLTKDITQEAASITSVATDYSKSLNMFVFALCAHNSLLVIQIKDGKISEYRLPNVEQVGGISIFKEELSIIVHNNQRLEHILIREAASVAATIFDYHRDQRLLDEIAKNSGQFQDIISMERKFSILFSHTEKTETYLILSSPSLKTSEVFFILVREGQKKEIVLSLQKVIPVQCFKCSDGICLCYFLEPETGKMLCVKLENGECAWTTCLLDGKENTWQNIAVNFQYSPGIGVYGIAEYEKEVLLISQSGLDFITVHDFAESVSTT